MEFSLGVISPQNFSMVTGLAVEVFARFYFLVKVTAGKVSINSTRDKGFHILLLLSDHMLFIIEKIFLSQLRAQIVGFNCKSSE